MNRGIAASTILLAAGLLGGCSPLEVRQTTRLETQTLPDLSGLAWVREDIFVAVHDAKNSDPVDRPRVSLLRLPRSRDGLIWQPQPLDWPAPSGPSSDLESAARIPGTAGVLLVESGSGGGQFRRIFLARYDAQRLQLVTVTNWPVPVQDVEGTAVARLSKGWVFIYAERAAGQSSTAVSWASLDPETMQFGPFRQVTFTAPDPAGPAARPISALEVDRAGQLYAASTFDSGNDDGPFRSVVWRIGQIRETQDSQPQVVLYPKPQRLATLDGLKVESLAIREPPDGPPELFIGTDDENYGGVLRLLILPSLAPPSTGVPIDRPYYTLCNFCRGDMR